MSGQGSIGLTFWARWVAASSVGVLLGFAVGIVFGFLLYTLAIFAIPEPAGEPLAVIFIVALLLGILGGVVLTSISQYLLIRRYLNLSFSWIPLTVGGWVAGLTLAGLVFSVIRPVAENTLNFAFGLALGLGIGLAQYIVLRTRLSHAGYWILANAFSWAIVITGADLISGAFGGAGLDPAGNLFLASAGACIAFLLATVAVAAFLGWVLVRLLRQTDRVVLADGP